MQNVTVRYYDTGGIAKFWGRAKGNCARCKEYKTLEEHHIKTRGRGGKRTVRLCRTCHVWVGQNIEEAIKLGLYEKGYEIKSSAKV
jgi:hypothetical protein